MSSDTVQISARAAQRVRGGYPWVFDTDVVKQSATDDVVKVVDPRGGLVGTALFSSAARIRLRMIARGEARVDAAWLEARVRAAVERRQHMMVGADAYRAVHAEADGLPGLVVDRYADVAVIQTATRAMDTREGELAQIVERVLGVRLVVARDDGSARDFEGLPRRSGILRGQGATRVSYRDAGSVVLVDVLADGKTGGFLDQVENHARAGEYARGDALDVCSYHGGFALAMCRRAASVLAVDENPAAVARIVENARANDYRNIDARVANAFDLLRALESDGRGFDTIVVDPPALAKRKSSDNAVDRAYKELNLRALRILRPGGVLLTFSCSGKMTLARFTEILEEAARDAGRTVTLLERRSAGRDHPVLMGVPETEYLKGLVLQVSA